MKPAAFEYVRAENVAHALEALSAAGGDGKIMAGGQSLVPMMNFRLVKPSVIIDINHIKGISGIERHGDRIALGALVRHRMTAEDKTIKTTVPILHAAMKHVAHMTVRNRGTFCGSICHADPAAEMPMLALLLNAQIRIASQKGVRIMPASDFFIGSLATALNGNEMVTQVEIDTLSPSTGWGFEEFARRHGDYALAAVAVRMEQVDGCARDVRIAIMGVGDKPMRCPAAEAVIEGSQTDPLSVDRAIDAVCSSITPNSDLHASSDYRRHLVGALMRRTLLAAWNRTRQGPTI